MLQSWRVWRTSQRLSPLPSLEQTNCGSQGRGRKRWGGGKGIRGRNTRVCLPAIVPAWALTSPWPAMGWGLGTILGAIPRFNKSGREGIPAGWRADLLLIPWRPILNVSSVYLKQKREKATRRNFSVSDFCFTLKELSLTDYIVTVAHLVHQHGVGVHLVFAVYHCWKSGSCCPSRGRGLALPYRLAFLCTERGFFNITFGFQSNTKWLLTNTGSDIDILGRCMSLFSIKTLSLSLSLSGGECQCIFAHTWSCCGWKSVDMFVPRPAFWYSGWVEIAPGEYTVALRGTIPTQRRHCELQPGCADQQGKNAHTSPLGMLLYTKHTFSATQLFLKNIYQATM